MKNKEDLPIIELVEDDNDNFKGIKNITNQICKILICGDTEFFRRDTENFFESNPSVKFWEEKAPKELSSNMKTYQEYNTDYDKDKLNEEIEEKGLIVPNGQYLFHGGILNLDEKNENILERPLATSFSPGMALFFASISGRAYDNERIELYILEANDVKTKAMILFQDGTNKHELEVLFSLGLNIRVTSKVRLSKDFKVKNIDETKEKEVPVYIFMCVIS